MTEEIIIDGVNVAGCNAYKEGHCLDKTAILLCDTNKCSNYNNCYYKQLKRLEFELKITKADYEASEQENKQMKSALEEIKNIVLDNDNYFTEDIVKVIDEVLDNESN